MLLNSRLDIAALDRHPVVVVGAPDALTADEVTRLTSFVRNRGGTLLLMPDRALSGPVMRLISLDWVERLQAEPVVVGTLRASELITADVTQPADETLATTTFGPAIVSTQTGLGRVIVSGALDAWRYRTDGTAYDRFWRAVVADAAAVAGPQVSVAVSPALVSPGGEVAVTVHGRSTEPRAEMTAEASWQCASDDARSLRVWPGTPSGTFVATVRVDAKVGDCQVTASISGLGSATGRFLVRNAPRSAPDAAQTGLNGAVAVTGGVRVGADDLGPIVTHLAALRSTNRQPEERHPMRSVWWLLPIAACLSVEWWLRRRGGLK